MKEKKSSEFVQAVLIAAGIMLACWLAVIIIAIGFRFLPAKDDETWKQNTTPLPKETVNDLCLNLLITDSSLCDGKKDVYAPDFYPRILELLANKNTTYQDVQRKLGKYQDSLGDLQKDEDGKPYFEVEYDLRGDGETWITFWFKGTYDENRFKGVSHHESNEGF